MNIEPIKGIYLGDRGIAFKKLIISLLKKGNIKQKYIDLLTTSENMEIFSAAFTSEQVDDNNNYQVYEQLGDLTGNKFIVCYIYKRFPQLKCAEGVKVAARLRINLGSKNSFCSIADNFGFWNFISCTNESRQRKKKPLLEDVFEAFLGATETILDNHTKTGVGYACVYKILGAIFDEIPISLKYEDLYDAKTRLKELFDIYSEKLGPLRYEEKREELIAYSMIYRLDPDAKNKKIFIGQGSAALKADAEQIAAADALKHLATQGYVKHAPLIYSRFAGGVQKEKQTTEYDIIRIIESTDQINNQFPTRGKSKYQNKYTSTALIHYCRKRDIPGIQICLKMKANPNIQDSEGMTALDALLIGITEEKIVTDIIKIMLGIVESLEVHKNVIQEYYRKYEDSSFFVQTFKNLSIIS